MCHSDESHYAMEGVYAENAWSNFLLIQVLSPV